MRWRFFVLLLLPLVALGADWKAWLSPGAAGASHSAFEGNCDACHLAFSGLPDGKCLDCHEGLAKRIAAGEGFHPTVRDQPCSTCHVDHKGHDASLTRAEALASFDHATTGFSTEGAHGRVPCARCHSAPVHEMDSVCVECHAGDDPHDSALGPTCDDCHLAATWPEGLPTLAGHKTEMTGGHAGLGCADCHPHGQNLLDEVVCNACHREAHGGVVTPCSDCHEIAGWLPAEFDHGPCTCTFAGAHQTATCLGCHPGFVFTDTPTLCSGCHADDVGHDPIGECSLCHEATTWSDNTFDHNRRTKFPIDGEHLRVDCAGCHTSGFAGLPTECASCHAEQGMTAHGDFGACTDCHTTTGFSPSSFDHATTGFTLTGRHADTPCQDCHAEKVNGYPGAVDAP